MRTLVNLGLAYNNKMEYMQGAQQFIFALCLNPRNEQIWSYFRQSILQADRFDLNERLNQTKDLKAFSSDFKLLNHSSLPQPSMDNLYNNKIFQS